MRAGAIAFLQAAYVSLPASCAQSITVLLIGSLKELACIFSELPIFKNSDPGNEDSVGAGLERDGKPKAGQIDT